MENDFNKLELKENWEKIFNLLNDGLMIVRPNGSIYYINRAMEHFLGYKRSEMIGKPCLMLKCDACEPLVSKTRETWCTLFDEGKDLQKDCLMVKKDGSYVPAIKKASLLHKTECEEKSSLIEALKKSMGNKSQAARLLGISRGTVWNRMRKYNINPKKILFS